MNADIIFLIDSSHLVGPNGFQAQKNFVRSLARYFSVRPGQSRAGVISYGNKANTAIGFQDYTSVSDFEGRLEKVSKSCFVLNIVVNLRHRTFHFLNFIYE